MITAGIRSLKALTKQLAALLVSLMIVLGLTQTAVFAASSPMKANSTELSGATPGITEPVSQEKVSEMQEQRREWQNEVSSARQTKTDEPSSFGEVLKEKLNLDEITEGYHPEEESENN
jgi:TolA-binding protein